MEKVGKNYTSTFPLWSILVDATRLQQPDKCGLEMFQTPGWLKNVSIPAKTQKYKKNIKQWNQITFGNIFQEKNALDQEMKRL